MSDERKMLGELARQLERWADESVSGGWSTHQVDAMRARARQIWELLGRKAIGDLPAESA